MKKQLSFQQIVERQHFQPANFASGTIQSKKLPNHRGILSKAEKFSMTSGQMEKKFRSTLPAANSSRANQSEPGLVDALLRAACTVSPFRKLLQRHSKELYTEEEASLTRPSFSKLDKLRSAIVTKVLNSYEWEDSSPVECFVKVIKYLSAFGGKEREVESVFSVGLNVVNICGKCAACERFPLTLCALRVVDFNYFETNASKEEIEHFNHRMPLSAENVLSYEDRQKYYSALKGRNSSETLQKLLLNSYCKSPFEEKWCRKCLKNTTHWKLSELQSFSPGLIISLPKGWNMTYVPEVLELKEKKNPS